MAKKKPKKAKLKRPKKEAPPAEAVPQHVVFYELRDVAGIRYHSEHVDLARARIVASGLVMSHDVAQAWILRDLEIVRRPEGS